MTFSPTKAAGDFTLAYLVEFRPGSGIYVNNVLFDGSLPNGPWNWPIPADVATLDKFQGQAPGGGGGAGHNAGTQRGGGSGGGSGLGFEAENLPVIPGSTVTVTIGSVGQGAALGGAATAGGNVQVDGILNPGGPTPNRMILTGGQPGTTASSGAGANGNQGGYFTSGGNGNGGAIGADGTSANVSLNLATAGRFESCGSGGGGGAGATGATAGNKGGTAYPYYLAMNEAFLQAAGGAHFPQSNGSTDGTNSYGGGGIGGIPRFGQPGLGGNGNVAGTTGSGYGGGGGGGGGNKPGANGSPGWVAFAYRSAL